MQGYHSKESEELTQGFAGIGLSDDDNAQTREKTLKYMQQLVRVMFLRRVCGDSDIDIATDSEP